MGGLGGGIVVIERLCYLCSMVNSLHHCSCKFFFFTNPCVQFSWGSSQISLQNLVSSLSYDCPLLLTTLTALGEIALLAPALFETQRPAIVRDFVVKELLMKDRVRSSQ